MIYSIHGNVDMVNVMLKSMIVSIVLMLVFITIWVYIADSIGLNLIIRSIGSFSLGIISAMIGLIICDGE